MEAVDDPEKATLVIKKGVDAELVSGGLRFVACRREVDEIDGGITLYVWSHPSAGGSAARELLRFDFFRNRPHYHSPAENQMETKIDPGGDGDSQAWGIEQLTSRAPELVAEAGFEQIAKELDRIQLESAGPQLADLFTHLAEPTEVSYFEVDAKVLAALR